MSAVLPAIKYANMDPLSVKSEFEIDYCFLNALNAMKKLWIKSFSHVNVISLYLLIKIKLICF